MGKSKYCDLHRGPRHNTKECYNLKMQVDCEIRKENLTDYVNKKLTIAKNVSQVNVTYVRFTWR